MTNERDELNELRALEEETDATQPKKRGRPRQVQEEVQEETQEEVQEVQKVENPNESIVLTKGELAEIQQEIAILKKSVSRYKLEENTAKMVKGKKVLPKGHLKRLNGKLIVKWLGVNEPGSNARQEILYQGTTPVGEILKAHYKTIDGEDVVTEAINFYRSTDLEYFTKLGQEGDEWIIQFDNPELPQSYRINTKFVNP